MGAPPEKKSIFRTECNSLWDEKKKKKKLNQIPIFKLWYIGQIYIIPKLIKEMIEKKKQKKQKKKTIAQLSIWKCGLGVLDIDTQ